MYTPGPDGMFFSLASSAGFISIGAESGHMRVSALVKPPRLVFIFAGVIHADPGPGIYGTDFQAAVFNPQLSGGKIHLVEFLVDGQCHTKFAGATGDVGIANRIETEF